MITRKISRIYIFLEYFTDIPHISHILRRSIDILSQEISYIVKRFIDISFQEIFQPRLGKRDIPEIFYINSRDS